jgi:hypothetical protein
LQHALDEQFDGAFAFFGFAYFGVWGEDAEGGVDGDLFYGLICGLVCALVCGLALGGGFGGGLGFGEVETGDLEAVEEQAGAAGVNVVGGDALEDFSDGGLDAGAVMSVM